MTALGMNVLLFATVWLLPLEAKAQPQVSLTPAQVSSLTKDFATWYRYVYHEAPLARQFKPLNTAGKLITRKAFLQQIMTGRVLFFAVGHEQEPIYRLYPYPGKDSQVRTISQRLAQDALYQVDRVGQPLPSFHFQDLQGTRYTPATTRGKVLVLKCWYIQCRGCVKEFPEVNALATKYRPNKDVLFVSLAFEGEAALRKFLQQRPLQYAVIPNMREYMHTILKVNGYPTHVVVGRDGRIAYMTNTAAYVDAAIKAAL
jgi:peroxiredoxin